GRGDLDPPAVEGAQGPLEPRGVRRVARDDHHGRRAIVVAHGERASSAVTKRRTSLIGIASARPPAIIVLRPTTWPDVSAGGPPESPGPPRRAAWIQRRPPADSGPSAWTMPAVSMPRSPSGWASATTSGPTQTVSEPASPA